MRITRSKLATGLSLVKSVAVGIVAAIMIPSAAQATYLDLTSVNEGSIVADVGGTAIFSLPGTRSTGTGLFDPFLRLRQQGNNEIEEAYNTDGRDGGQPPLDGVASIHTHSLQLQDLATIEIDGTSYYFFEMDAHEPDAGTKKYLSIDNIRIYTAPVADGGDAITETIDDLGTLRFALNEPNYTDPNLPGGEPENWVKFDASHNYSTGSGESDVFLFVPVSAFAAALPTDYIYFYNLNGVHFIAEAGTEAEATFEEWRALTGGGSTVPDGGVTVTLLGSVLCALALFRHRSKAGRN